MIHWILMIAGLALSFVLLVKGADFFVDGCVSIARLLRVPDLIIGLTIVAMGTSAPEAAVSISGAISSPEDAGITVGNLLGSNLLNILLILGISAVIVPIKVDPSLLKKDFPLLLGSGIIVPPALLGLRNGGKPSRRCDSDDLLHHFHGLDSHERPLQQKKISRR